MLDPQDQLALVHGLRNGCRDAWTSLYDKYSGDVWRYVARLLGNDAAAVADVVQETFLGAAQSARQFDPKRGSLGAWLTGIAHHRVGLHWRQVGRANRLLKMAENGAAEVLHWLENPEPLAQVWERQDIADLVRSVLAELPVDYATLLMAKYLEDRSLADLAQERGDSTEAIKSKLARARREFRGKFARLTRESSPMFPE